MMKRRYLTPICAGLVTLAGLGTMIKGVTDVFSQGHENFPKIKELIEVQNQRGSLEYKFYVKQGETTAKQLFENNKRLLNQFLESENQINILREKENELLKRPAIKSEYESYLQYDLMNREKADGVMVLGFGLFAPGIIYFSRKYGGGSLGL